MANVALMLREEIIRLSRKEIRKATAVLQRSSATHRREIAQLKRHVLELSKQLKLLHRVQSGAPQRMVAASDSDTRMRFVAKGFRTLRRRLGLSAGEMGRLLGVSEQSIYNWETQTAVPRRTHLPAITKLRGLGKREVQHLLAQPRS